VLIGAGTPVISRLGLHYLVDITWYLCLPAM
jgi:hypothetical protein